MWRDAVSTSAPRGVSKEGLSAPLFGLFFFPYSFCWHKKNMAAGGKTKRQSLSQHLIRLPLRAATFPKGKALNGTPRLKRKALNVKKRQQKILLPL